MSFSPKGITHRPTVTGRRGMVSSAHPLASVAGLRILMEGGNAIDAAVATAAALNVVEPYMSGIGGDGYMHIYHSGTGDHQILDYMGLSPKATTLDAFDSEEAHKRGPKTPLIPGACGGWLAALERYGTMDAGTVFAPAIEYAEQGFAVTVKNAAFIDFNRPALLEHSPAAQSYLINGQSPKPGQVIVQADLAATFRKVAQDGADVFYRGEIAERMINHLQSTGGLMTMEDLAEFTPIWHEPIHTTYRGHRIYAPPPPCQGIEFLETLNILEGFDIGLMGHNTAQTLHKVIETIKIGIADRAEFIALENPPTSGLLSKGYAAEQRKRIEYNARPTGGDRYTKSKALNEVVAGNPYDWLNSECTTHFDVVDEQGNAVAVTQSLGGGFGSAVVIPGTGVALNNFIYWFDRNPDSPNAIGPSKKIEMCMSPVQIWDDDGLRTLIGTPGSYGILQTTPQMIMNLIDHGMNIQAAIEAPRLTVTAPGYGVNIESRVSESVLTELMLQGHQFNRLGDWSALVGGGQGIMIDPETGSFMGGADPRRDGYAIGW
ncbi:MAG: gamma-glutamyltransferase [Chloroflexota bacterium]